MDYNTTVYKDNTTNPPEARLFLGPSIIGAVLGSMFIAVAIFGNVVTIVIIAITKSLRKPIYLPVATLAANDLVASLMSTIFIHTYIKQEWTMGSTWCKVVLMMKAINFCISLLHTAFLALVHYLSVVHSIQLQLLKSWRSAAFTSGVIFLIPVVFNSVKNFAVYNTAFSTSTHFTFNPYLMSCRQHSQNLNIYALLCTLVGFFVVWAVYFIYCYCHIYVVLRKSRIGIQDQLSFASQQSRRRKENDLLKLMGSITVVFLVSFLTTIVFSIIERSGIHISQYGYVAAVQTLYLSPVCNWIIYGLRKKSFRVALKRLVTCAWSVQVHIQQEVAMEMVNP